MRLLSLACLLIGLSLNAQEAWTDKTRVLPDKLRQIPEAVFIYHDPNPNFPESDSAHVHSKYDYVWKHSTSVIAPEKELEVFEAGSFIWYSEAGWKQNVLFDRKEFAKKFNCKKGILMTGERYTFEKNYRYGSQLYGGDALWYILAKDNAGNIYRGFSILETEAELKKP